MDLKERIKKQSEVIANHPGNHDQSVHDPKGGNGTADAQSAAKSLLAHLRSALGKDSASDFAGSGFDIRGTNAFNEARRFLKGQGFSYFEKGGVGVFSRARKDGGWDRLQYHVTSGNIRPVTEKPDRPGFAESMATVRAARKGQI